MSDSNLPAAVGSLQLDGQQVPVFPGDRLLDLTRRHGKEVPTLCHDPRLDAAGCCRTCLVEVDGWRRMPPACATPAEPGMVVNTDSPRVQKHRETLFSLYLTDHPQDPAEQEPGPPNDLLDLAQRFGGKEDWPAMEPMRRGRPEDRNPYVDFRPEACILCARCTRYCDEVEGVSAISLAERGAKTTIATVDHVSLLDSSCELCGGCIDVCPTGAMAEKMPLQRQKKPERELEKVRTTCNFCGVGCQLDLNVDPEGRDGLGEVVKITSPEPGTTTNDGNLCVKGRFAYDFIHHPERLTEPMIRDAGGRLQPVSWDEALQYAADGLRKVQQRHGPDALGFISSSRCTVEENYLVQKLARTAFQTHNVHQCAAT